MTREEIDFWPILHAIPLVGLDAGAQFFGDDGPEEGRYGVRGIVKNAFQVNTRISNVQRGIPAWKAFTIEQVYCVSNVVLVGNVTLKVAGRASTQRVIEVERHAAALHLVQPFSLLSERLVVNHTLEEMVKRSGVPLNLDHSLCAVGKLAAFFTKLAAETREKNSDWHHDPNRNARDRRINDVMTLLQGLHDVVATVPLVVFGFAGRATIEVL